MRFEVDPKAARRQNILVAVVACLALPAFLWFAKGERDPVVLVSFGALTGACTLVYYTWRLRRRGHTAIEFTPSGLRVEGRNPVEVRWVDVVQAERSSGSNDYWDFELASGRVRVSLDGHSFDHIGAINETIEAVMRAAGLQ